MKKVFVLLAVLFLIVVLPAAAGEDGGKDVGGPKYLEKTPSESAYDHANENAAFKRKERRKKGKIEDREKELEENEEYSGDVGSRQAKKEERMREKEERKAEKRKRKEERRKQKENTYRGEKRDRYRAKKREMAGEE